MDGFHSLSNEPRWSNILKPIEVPWVLDHAIGGQIILPGSAMLSIVIEACQKILDPTKTVEGFEFREVNFTRALLFQTPDQAIEIALQLRPHYLGTKTMTFVWHRFKLVSLARDNAAVEHSNGLVRVKYMTKSGEVENRLEHEKSLQKYRSKYSKVVEKAVHDVNTSMLYNEIHDAGIQFGPLFRLLSETKGGEDVGLATLIIPDIVAVMPENFEYPLLVHPTVIDGVFQVLFSRSSCSDAKVGMSVITSIGSLYVLATLPNSPGTALKGYQRSKQVGPRQVLGNLVISDSEFSQPFIIIEDIVSAGINSDDSKSAQTGTMLCTHMEWKKDVASLTQEAFESIIPIIIPDQEVQKNDEILERAAAIYIKRAIDTPVCAATVNESFLLRKAWIRDLLPLESDTYLATSSAKTDDQTLIASSKTPQVGTVLEAVGSRLSEIMAGSIEVAEIIHSLSESEPLSITEHLLNMDCFNASVSAWFDLAGFKNANLKVY